MLLGLEILLLLFLNILFSLLITKFKEKL